MENFTHFNKTSFTFERRVWISNIASKSIFFVISLYLLIALIYHQIIVEKHKEAKFLQLTLERKYVVLSKYTCIATAVFSTITFFSGFVLNTLEGNSAFSEKSTQQSSATEVGCYILPQIGSVAISLASLFVFFFLWLRQSIFYVHSSLKHLYTTCLKVFSFSVLIFFFLFGVCVVFTANLLIEVRYALNEAGLCQAQIRGGDAISYLQILIAWNVSSILMQMSLLGLFIYPILKQASWQNKLFGKGKKEKKITTNNSTLRRVKKAVILASVCVITDILTAFAVLQVFANNANTALMYEINLLINQLATIACFDYWKKLLWPWNRRGFTVSANTKNETSTEQTANCTKVTRL